MVINLEIGLKGLIEQTVSKDDTASKYGSGMVEVFATPAMIALMESTAMKSVLQFLPDGYNTVGIEINTKHLKATPVGMKVRCESVLTKIDGKKLYFSIDAFDEVGQIGSCNHIRYIIETKSFMEKINS